MHPPAPASPPLDASFPRLPTTPPPEHTPAERLKLGARYFNWLMLTTQHHGSVDLERLVNAKGACMLRAPWTWSEILGTGTRHWLAVGRFYGLGWTEATPETAIINQWCDFVGVPVNLWASPWDCGEYLTGRGCSSTGG